MNVLQSTPATTRDAVSFALKSPLLLAGNAPASAGGAIAYLYLLSSCIEAAQQNRMSVSLHEWLDEAVRLRSQLLQLKVSRLIAPTALDMSVKIWGGLHKCIEVRRKAKGSTAQIDTALALGLLNYAAQNIPANETFVQGIRAIYRASARMEVHGDWHTLNSLESLDEFNLTQILPALEHKPCRRFVVEMTNFLKTPIPRFVISHRETSLPQGAQPNRISDVEESSEQEQAHDGIEDFQDQTCEADTTTDKATEAPRREFQRGDSILDWHSGRAKFKSRNERLALIVEFRRNLTHLAQ